MDFTALPAVALGDGLTIRIAATRGSRLRGLAGLTAMPHGTALLLVPCRSIHTFGMRFALDVVWLDGAGAPLDVLTNLRPGRTASRRRAHAALECPAGSGHAFEEALSSTAAHSVAALRPDSW